MRRPEGFTFWTYASHGNELCPELVILVEGCAGDSEVHVKVFTDNNVRYLFRKDFIVNDRYIPMNVFHDLIESGQLKPMELRRGAFEPERTLSQ